MMPTDRFERQLPELLTELAEPRTPDYLDDLLWQTANTSQRPAWTLLERWIPMERTLNRMPDPKGLRYIVLFGLLLLATAVALSIVGSQRRLPAPFGPAGNGVIAFATETGDIAVGDPVTGVTTTIVDSPGRDTDPVFSRDGTQIAFTREVNYDADKQVFVVDATGGTPIELTNDQLPVFPVGNNAAPSSLEWSPDSSLVAWVTDGSLWIAKADGSSTAAVDLELTVDDFEWRPPAGSELLVLGTARNAQTGLFLVNADGGDLRLVTSLTGGDATYLSWSPDGNRFAYSTFPAWQAHMVTMDGLRETVIEPIGGMEVIFPQWSPDGSQLALEVRQDDGSTRFGVVAADTDSPLVTLTGPRFLGLLEHNWSPDGSAILAVQWTRGTAWLLDPTGGPETRANWSSVSGPAWQRLAP